MGPLEQASGKHGCVLEMRLDHRRESTAACCVYEDPKEKKCFFSSLLSSTQGFASFSWFRDVFGRRKWKHLRGDCWPSSFTGLKKDNTHKPLESSDTKNGISVMDARGVSTSLINHRRDQTKKNSFLSHRSPDVSVTDNQHFLFVTRCYWFWIYYKCDALFYISVNGGSYFNLWEKIINKGEVIQTFSSPSYCSCSLTMILHEEMLMKIAKLLICYVMASISLASKERINTDSEELSGYHLW